jgi:hypothetical protein
LGAGPAGATATVQLAVGASGGGEPGRLWDLWVTPRGGTAQWRTFYNRHTGAPRVLVVEPDTTAAAVARDHWPAWPPVLVEFGRSADVEAHGGLAGTDIDALRQLFGAWRHTIFRRLAGRHAHFSNPVQLEGMLHLIRLDLNGEADPVVYAGRIRTTVGG